MRRRPTIAGGLALTAGLALAGCGTDLVRTHPVALASPSTAAAVPSTPTAVPSTPTAVPWLDAPATPPDTGPIPRATARPCGAADLPATATHTGTGGISQSTSAVILVRNDGPSPCTLSTGPRLLNTDSRGRLRPVPAHPAADDDPFGPATIDPGEDAGITVWFQYACPGPTVTYRRLVLEQAGKHIAVPGLSLSGTCGAVNIEAWMPPVEHLAQPAPRFGALTALIEAPSSVHAGGTLDYMVTLTNTGLTAVPLDPCPVYTEQFFKFAESYRLNCAPGSIAPGGIAAGASVRFAMRIEVLPYAPAGPTRLDWAIAEAAGPSAQDSATVTVTG